MKPKLEIIAGPNGCGKTTLSEYLIEQGKLTNLVNADIIAKGLDASNIKGGEITAGKIMLSHIKEQIRQKKHVSFETTLSGKIWIKVIKEAKNAGYDVFIYYLIVSDPEIAIRRIENRVAQGGHHIPRETVIRRFKRSKDLFINVYSKLANHSFVFDNSNGNANLIAKSEDFKELELIDEDTFREIFK